MLDGVVGLWLKVDGYWEPSSLDPCLEIVADKRVLFSGFVKEAP